MPHDSFNTWFQDSCCCHAGRENFQQTEPRSCDCLGGAESKHIIAHTPSARRSFFDTLSLVRQGSQRRGQVLAKNSLASYSPRSIEVSTVEARTRAITIQTDPSAAPSPTFNRKDAIKRTARFRSGAQAAQFADALVVRGVVSAAITASQSIVVRDHLQIMTEAEEKRGCCGGCESFFLYNKHDPVVQAFYLNQFGRSALFISFMFLSLGILQLANEQAGCPKNEDGGYACTDENKVYGSRPSSILALMALVGGLSVSVFMPYFGAVVDYTDYRRGCGRVCAALLVAANFVQIFIYESTWYAMVIVQAVVATAAFYGNSMVMWSYVGAENQVDLAGVTASGRMWETMSMLGFFIVMAVVSFATPWDAVGRARFGQALACLAGAPTLFMAYHKRYPIKKSLKSIAEGSNLYKEGILDLWKTIVKLGKTNPAAQRYLFTIMFTDAAVGGFTNLVIAGPDQKYGSYAFAVIYGGWYVDADSEFAGTIATLLTFELLISYGHYYPTTNGYFVSLVPEDKVVELWGWNMFAGVILSWIPPLVFTSINETSGNLRLGMIGMIGFLFIGFILSLTIPETSVEKYSIKSTKEVKDEGENNDEKADADSTDDSGDNQQKEAESNV
ncbi:hypothetical protein THAOC_17195 [Thalassiosira oceanica]|uniref:Uncharacterized protein n=1 Tax=Thalassiosira oceanica TaxID=159749 RepID=K0SBB1_THAOC|nr:hypothetical protein THAOC_17195 [Thalassiosira oceanica]|eukprot:EJK62199.1 hypothetical protein THAOC_17195 [Thalassiosira oceanica]